MRVMTSALICAGMSGFLMTQAFAETSMRPSIGLAKAVAIAETELGAKAFDAELDAEPHGLLYEINLVKDGRAIKAEVDAADGKILRKQEASSLKMPWGGEELKAAQAAPRSLTETIAMVEKSTKGQVSEIGLESRKGRHYYEVELVGAQDRAVLVDMKTGAFTPLLDD